MADIFDQIAEPDIFESVDSEDTAVDSLKAQLNDVLAQFDNKERKKEHAKLKAEFEKTLKEEISKIKPIQQVIERTFEKQTVKNVQVPVYLEPKVVKSPPQIIRETRVEVQTEKKDLRKLVEEKTIDELRGEIKGLKDELEMLRQTLPMIGGSGVIGIPPPEPNPVNYVLTVDSNKKAAWKASSGGGIAAGTFTVSNNTPSYNFDSTGDTVDNLYQVVATLIRKLQGEL